MNDITEREELLIERCIQAKNFAHAPYSKFRVGAAVLSKDGTIFTGKLNTDPKNELSSLCY